MKRTRNFLAMLLALMLMLSLLPISVLADDGQFVHISENVRNGNGTATIKFSVDPPYNTADYNVYIAGYSENQKMLDVKIVNAAADKLEATLNIGSATLNKVKAFLLDSNNKPLSVNGDDSKIVTTSGAIVTGYHETLIISQSVGDGQVYLDGATVENLVVNGGGSHSIYLQNGSQVGSAVIDKGSEAGTEAPRLAVDGSSGVKNVAVNGENGATIESTSGTGYVGEVTVGETAAETTTIKNMKVDTVRAANNVTLDGSTVDKVSTESEKTVTVTVDNSAVNTVEAQAPTTVAGSGGTVSTVTATKSVTTKAGTNVGTITANGTDPVTAKGNVNTIAANGGAVEVGGSASPVITGTASTVTVKENAAPVVEAKASNINVDTGSAGNTAKAGVTVGSECTASVNVIGAGTAGAINVENSSSSVSIESGAAAETVAVAGNNNISGAGTTTKTAKDTANATLTLDHIEIASYPAKLTYAVESSTLGSTLDLTGMVVKGYYTVEAVDGEVFDGQVSKTLKQGTDGYSISGFDAEKAGVKVITVSCGDKTATFPVTIADKQVSLVALTTLPTKTVYENADIDLDLTGGKLTVAYTNSALYPNEPIDLPNQDVTATGFSKGVVGTQTIVLSYSGFTAAYSITVNGDKAADLQAAKEAAINMLNSYGNRSDYHDPLAFEAAKQTGRDNINAADDEDGVNKALSDAKSAINALETVAQYDASELAKAKSTAKTELVNYKQEQCYTPAAWRLIQSKIATWSSAIDSCPNIDDVNTALEDAKKELDGVVNSAVAAVTELKVEFIHDQLLVSFKLPNSTDCESIEKIDLYACPEDGSEFIVKTVSKANLNTFADCSYYLTLDDFDVDIYTRPGVYTFKAVSVSGDTDKYKDCSVTAAEVVNIVNSAEATPYDGNDPVIYTVIPGHTNTDGFAIAATYKYSSLLAKRDTCLVRYKATSAARENLDTYYAATDTDLYLRDTDKDIGSFTITKYTVEQSKDGYTATMYAPSRAVSTAESSAASAFPVQDVNFVRDTAGNLSMVATLPQNRENCNRISLDFFKNDGSEAEETPDIASGTDLSASVYDETKTTASVSLKTYEPEISETGAYDDITSVRVATNGDWGSNIRAAYNWFDIKLTCSVDNTIQLPANCAARYDIGSKILTIAGLTAGLNYTVSIDASGSELFKSPSYQYSRKIVSVTETADSSGVITLTHSSFAWSDVVICDALATDTAKISLRQKNFSRNDNKSANIIFSNYSDEIPCAAYGISFAADESAIIDGVSAYVNPGSTLTLKAYPAGVGHTYAWYSSNTNENSGGTKVGADSTYTPATATAGTTYYYCVIDGVTTSAVKVWVGDTSTLYAPQVSNAKLEIGADDVLCANFTPPASTAAISWYGIRYKDNDNSPMWCDYRSAESSSFSLLDTTSHLPDGIYNFDIISKGGRVESVPFDSEPTPVYGTANVINLDSSTPGGWVITCAMDANGWYVYSITAPAPGTYSFELTKNNCSATFSHTFASDALTYKHNTTSTTYFEYCSIQKSRAVAAGDGEFNCFFYKTYNMPLSEPVAVSVSSTVAGEQYLDSQISVDPNTAVTLTAASTGIDAPSYQWYRCDNTTGDNAQAVDSSSATCTPPTDATGRYYYYCLVNGTYQSRIITVSVSNPAPPVTNVNLGLDDNGILNVTFTKPVGAAYDWLYKIRLIDSNGNSSSPITTDVDHCAISGRNNRYADGTYTVSVSTMTPSNYRDSDAVTAEKTVTISNVKMNDCGGAVSCVKNGSSYTYYADVTGESGGVFDFKLHTPDDLTLPASRNSVKLTKGVTTQLLQDSREYTTCDISRNIYRTNDDGNFTLISSYTKDVPITQAEVSVTVTGKDSSNLGYYNTVEVSSNSGLTYTLTAAVTGIQAENYQWFSCSNSAGGNGTLVNCNSATFQLPTSANGTYYYYCLVNGAFKSNVMRVNVAPTAAAVKDATLSLGTDGALHVAFTKPDDVAGISSYSVCLVKDNSSMLVGRAGVLENEIIVSMDTVDVPDGDYSVYVCSNGCSGYRQSDFVQCTGNPVVTVVNSTTEKTGLTVTTGAVSRGDCTYTFTAPAPGVYSLKLCNANGSSQAETLFFTADRLSQELCAYFNPDNTITSCQATSYTVAEADGGYTLTRRAATTVPVTVPPTVSPVTNVHFEKCENGGVCVAFDRPADTSKIERYEVDFFNENNQWVAGNSTDTAAEGCIKIPYADLEPGIYTVSVQSVPVGSTGCGRSVSAKGTGTLTIADGTEQTPACTVKCMGFSSDGNTKYKITVPEAGTYQFMLVSKTDDGKYSGVSPMNTFTFAEDALTKEYISENPTPESFCYMYKIDVSQSTDGNDYTVTYSTTEDVLPITAVASADVNYQLSYVMAFRAETEPAGYTAFVIFNDGTAGEYEISSIDELDFADYAESDGAVPEAGLYNAVVTDGKVALLSVPEYNYQFLDDNRLNKDANGDDLDVKDAITGIQNGSAFLGNGIFATKKTVFFMVSGANPDDKGFTYHVYTGYANTESSAANCDIGCAYYNSQSGKYAVAAYSVGSISESDTNVYFYDGVPTVGSSNAAAYKLWRNGTESDYTPDGTGITPAASTVSGFYTKATVLNDGDTGLAAASDGGKYNTGEWLNSAYNNCVLEINNGVNADFFYSLPADTDVVDVRSSASTGTDGNYSYCGTSELPKITNIAGIQAAVEAGYQVYIGVDAGAPDDGCCGTSADPYSASYIYVYLLKFAAVAPTPIESPITTASLEVKDGYMFVKFTEPADVSGIDHYNVCCRNLGNDAPFSTLAQVEVTGAGKTISTSIDTGITPYNGVNTVSVVPVYTDSSVTATPYVLPQTVTVTSSTEKTDASGITSSNYNIIGDSSNRCIYKLTGLVNGTHYLCTHAANAQITHPMNTNISGYNDNHAWIVLFGMVYNACTLSSYTISRTDSGYTVTKDLPSDPISITQHSVTAAQNGAELSLTIAPAEEHSYQWRYSETNDIAQSESIENATDSTYTATKNGYYWCLTDDLIISWNDFYVDCFGN